MGWLFPFLADIAIPVFSIIASYNIASRLTYRKHQHSATESKRQQYSYIVGDIANYFSLQKDLPANKQATVSGNDRHKYLQSLAFLMLLGTPEIQALVRRWRRHPPDWKLWEKSEQKKLEELILDDLADSNPKAFRSVRRGPSLLCSTNRTGQLIKARRNS